MKILGTRKSRTNENFCLVEVIVEYSNCPTSYLQSRLIQTLYIGGCMSVLLVPYINLYVRSVVRLVTHSSFMTQWESCIIYDH